MKKIKQGQTIFVVEGSHKNNTFLHRVFVAKTYTSKVEESCLETRFKGIEEKEITEEQIKQATGIDKLFLTCSPRVRKLHVYEQELVKTLRPHQIIEDIAGNAFDVNDSQFRVYMERKRALKDFSKTSKKSNLRLYETNIKESLFGDTQVVELHPSTPKCTIGVAYPSSLMDSDVLERIGREGRKYGVQILIPAKNVCVTLKAKP